MVVHNCTGSRYSRQNRVYATGGCTDSQPLGRHCCFPVKRRASAVGQRSADPVPLLEPVQQTRLLQPSILNARSSPYLSLFRTEVERTATVSRVLLTPL